MSQLLPLRVDASFTARAKRSAGGTDAPSAENALAQSLASTSGWCGVVWCSGWQDHTGRAGREHTRCGDTGAHGIVASMAAAAIDGLVFATPLRSG